MNERIQELIEQCTVQEFSDCTGGFETFDKAKFADSLVWECMKICEDVMKKDNSALGCWSEIKRKFRS